MTTKIISLLAGELIIAQINEEDLKKDGVKLIKVKNGNNIIVDHKQQGLSLIPIGVPVVDGDVEIAITSIAWIGDPVKELKDKYIASVSGIITPSGPNLKLTT